MKYLKFILLLIVLAFTISLFFYVPKLIFVNKISCKSQFGPCSTSLSEKLASKEGKNLKEVKKEVKEVLSYETSVSDFSLQFRIPASLNVFVVEKKPKFAVKQENYFGLIDKEGIVLRIEKATSLPYVEIQEKIPGVGEKVNEKTFFALNAVYNLFIQYQVRSGVISGNFLVIDSIEGRQVIFPLEGDLDVLLGALRLIINRLNASAKDTRIETSVKEIDLRFKNPVLR